MAITADIALNFALAVSIFVLWGVCGLAMFIRRDKVPRRYWLAWGAAFTVGALQMWTLLHAIFPGLVDSPSFVSGMLRGTGLVLLVSFLAAVRADDE